MQKGLGRGCGSRKPGALADRWTKGVTYVKPTETPGGKNVAPAQREETGLAVSPGTGYPSCVVTAAAQHCLLRIEFYPGYFWFKFWFSWHFHLLC